MKRYLREKGIQFPYDVITMDEQCIEAFEFIILSIKKIAVGIENGIDAIELFNNLPILNNFR